MLYTIYVDSLYGSDLNIGDLTSPVKTLTYALSIVYEGGEIILQNGDGSSYGDLSVSKNVSIKAAYGTSPIVGTLTLTDVQGLIEGLTFNSLSKGIVASNTYVGSLAIRGCIFNSVVTAIEIFSVNYLSLHRNFFTDYTIAVKILNSTEICASSNIFSNGLRAFQITTVKRLDLWRNTIYGALDLPPVPFPDTDLRIVYYTLTSFDIFYKRLQLPGYADDNGSGEYDVAFNVVNGPSFNYGSDFTVLYFGSMISWEGLRLENELAVNDVVRVMYSEAGDIESGDAIQVLNIGDENSRFDSNSLSGKSVGAVDTPISIGIFSNTPLKVNDNNFDMVTTPWDGFTPTGETGIDNIGETAMYRDPNADDFRLLPSSPNIDRGDAERWNNIYEEMGIIKIGDSYTASYTGIREQVSPFDRDLDFDLFHRGATGIQGLTGDIGAFEYNVNETAMGDYVAEYGFDKAYPGTETGPYASPDRGYQRAGANDLHIATNFVPYMDGATGPYIIPSDGSSYSRFRSKNIVLNDSDIIVGERTDDDVIIIYPSNPSVETGMCYVSPDGSDTGIGDGTYLNPYRTIKKALEVAPSAIIVEPGYYPSFKGVTGVKLIGIERFKDIGLSGVLYSNVRDGSWTGSPGAYELTRDDVTLSAPADVIGEFVFNPGVDFKVFATVKSTDLTIKVFNNNNNAFIKISRLLSVVTLGYTTGGVSYEVNKYIPPLYTLDERFSDIKVQFVLKDDKFTIYYNNKYISGSYSNMFSSGSFTDWRVQFFNTGTGDDTIFNISAFSTSLTGATGLTSTVTLKKLFAITGATGIQPSLNGATGMPL